MKIGVDDSTTTPSRFITISVVCCLMSKIRGGGGTIPCDLMVFGFTTTYAINTYQTKL